MHNSDKPLLKTFSQSFLKRADEAAFWEAYVGACLARAGFYVVNYPMKFGEYHDPKGSLSSDLRIYHTDPELWEPGIDEDFGIGLEVKSRNIYFTSPEDYKWDEVRVCSEIWFKKNWGAYDKFARDFFLVSQKTGVILWIPAGTQAQFGKTITDTERNERFKVVQCNKSDLRTFKEFCDAHKEKEPISI